MKNITMKSLPYIEDVVIGLMILLGFLSLVDYLIRHSSTVPVPSDKYYTFQNKEVYCTTEGIEQLRRYLRHHIYDALPAECDTQLHYLNDPFPINPWKLPLN